MSNAKTFLENARFVPPKEAISSEKVVIERASVNDRSKKVHFSVTDDAKSLKPRDWDRVVAVFASGKEWQFKDYPMKSPAEIFDQTCGFHLCWDDEAIKDTISKWKVHKLKVSKAYRHKDQSVVMEFWQMLCDFIRSHPKKSKTLVY